MYKLFLFACMLVLVAAKPQPSVVFSSYPASAAAAAYTLPAAYAAPAAAYAAPAAAYTAAAASAFPAYPGPLSAYSGYPAPVAAYSAYSYASPYSYYAYRR